MELAKDYKVTISLGLVFAAIWLFYIQPMREKQHDETERQQELEKDWWYHKGYHAGKGL